MKKSKGYAVMRLVRMLELESSIIPGLKSTENLTSTNDGRIGMLPVYRYKKDARRIWGNDVELMEINIEVKEEGEVKH